MDYLVFCPDNSPTILSIFKDFFFPFLNVIVLFFLHRVIAKNANLDIKKRELLFSFAKDLEQKIEKVVELHREHIESKKKENSKKVRIEITVINNLFKIMIDNFENYASNNAVSDTKLFYNELVEFMSDIQFPHRKAAIDSLEKDLILKYSKFLGSFTKLKFSILNSKKK